MRLRNSLTGDLQEVEPGADGRIGMYFCGPTVYNRIHIGNARPFVVSMLMKRYLEWRGRPVTLVENITDINDKIYTAAAAAGVPSGGFAAEMSDAYIADTDRLGLGRPDREPRATETVEEIVSLIEELIASGHAYEAGGDVYFAVRSFPDYGRLSNQRTDQLREGGDTEGGEHKRDPLDFALWKATKPDEDTSWDSPWGKGRPGWHIECSAMAERWLGREFAVHGGGRDLVFPHHENEIAQSQAAGRRFAQVWAHNGMLRLGGEKMSKSVGNISLLPEVIGEWGAETILMFFARGHYRQPIVFAPDTLRDAQGFVRRIREAGRRLVDGPSPDDMAPLRDDFFTALRDDFNTPRAVAALAAWVSEANRREGVGRDALVEMLDIFGLAALAAGDAEGDGPDEAALALLEARNAARAQKDWAEADRLRDALAEAGWVVRDGPDGAELVRP